MSANVTSSLSSDGLLDTNLFGSITVALSSIDNISRFESSSSAKFTFKTLAQCFPSHVVHKKLPQNPQLLAVRTMSRAASHT